MLPKEPMKNSVFSKNEIGSETLGVSATPTFLTEPIFSTHTAAVKRKASLHNEKTDASHRFFWRRHPDLNRGIKVLQTSALPLGYVAVLAGVAGFEPAHD